MSNGNENIMENMNIKKLSLKMATPMVISMLSLALYNLVDSIFVSNIGNSALTAISLAYPIQAIITAIALGTSIGVNSLISRKLGEKDKITANKTSVNGIILIFLSYIFVALLSCVLIKPLLSLFTKDSTTLNYTNTYLSICIMFSFGLSFQILFEKISEAYGKTVYSMLIQFIGAIINLILDPLLIYGWKFIPGFGIKGAAIATVIGQVSGMVLGIILLYKRYIKLELKCFKLDKRIVSDIYKVGFPTIISESLAAFVSLILNKLLISFSEYAVPLFGIYNKVQSFIFMIVYGFNYGMIPIVGYNFGAKKYLKMKKVIKLFLVYAEVIMILGIIIFVFGGNVIFNIYSADTEIIKIGIFAFRVLSIGFIFAGVSLVLSSVFQAIGKGKYSLIIYLFRQLIINIPVIWALSYTKNIQLIWFVFVISEIIAMIVSFLIYKKEVKKLS